MSNRGKERKSLGGGADLYLPHLRPKGFESQNSPRSHFGGIVTGAGAAKSTMDPSEINGSQCSPRKLNGSMLSPILKGK